MNCDHCFYEMAASQAIHEQLSIEQHRFLFWTWQTERVLYRGQWHECPNCGATKELDLGSGRIISRYPPMKSDYQIHPNGIDWVRHFNHG